MSVHLPRGRVIDRPDVSGVGRRPELACLHARLDRTRAGEPRFVLVEGPAGIGKTALIRQFPAHAGEVCVLGASGEEAESSLSLGVLAQRATHAPSVPANPLTALLGSDQHPRGPVDAGAALVDLLGELQHHSPVMVVMFDDVHWLNSPPLYALAFALRCLREGNVLALVLTREGTDLRLPEGLRRALADDHACACAVPAWRPPSYLRLAPILRWPAVAALGGAPARLHRRQPAVCPCPARRTPRGDARGRRYAAGRPVRWR